MRWVNLERIRQCLFLLSVMVFFVFLQACADDEAPLRPKINKYDLFKEEHPAVAESKGLLSEATAIEKSILVVKVNRLILIDSTLKRGGSQYLYSASEVNSIIKTANQYSTLNSLMFISATKFDVNVTAGSPMTLFLDSLAAASPLKASGIKYKWLLNAPVL